LTCRNWSSILGCRVMGSPLLSRTHSTQLRKPPNHASISIAHLSIHCALLARSLSLAPPLVDGRPHTLWGRREADAQADRRPRSHRGRSEPSGGPHQPLGASLRVRALFYSISAAHNGAGTLLYALTVVVMCIGAKPAH